MDVVQFWCALRQLCTVPSLSLALARLSKGFPREVLQVNENNENFLVL